MDGKNNTELKDMTDTLRPGKALWLVTDEPVELNVSDGISVNSVNDFVLRLKQGWNLIGSPFAFPVAWPQGVGILRDYTGNSNWPEVNVLHPYRGVAVKVDQDVDVNIPGTEFIAAGKAMAQNSDTDDILLKFRIMVKSNLDEDSYNYAIVREKTSDSLIARYEPPPVGKFNILYFMDENINNKTERLSTVVSNRTGGGYQFRFTMESNLDIEKEIIIYPEKLSDDMTWVVASSSTGLVYSGNNIKTVAFKRNYLLIVGTEQYISNATSGYRSMPEQFLLTQNYPNPFNPSTRIEIQVPEESRISVQIYDLLGRKINTLINNRFFEPGYHTLEWNGTNDTGKPMASGVYFLTVRSMQYNRTIKMILQR